MNADAPTDPAIGAIVEAFWRSSTGLAILGLDGRVLVANETLCRLLGRTRGEVEGSFWDEGLVDDVAADRHHRERLLSGEIPGFHRTAVLRRADGRPVRVVLAVALVRGDGGEPRHLVGHVIDAAGSEEVDREVRTLADVDPLTGVFNRRRFDYELDRALSHARRHGTTTAVLMVDVDGLKAVNDTHGHLAGDDLIVAVARRMGERLRLSDVLARIGGDEFAILLPETGADAAARVADDLVAAVRARPVRVDGKEVPASVTAGIAVADPEAGDDRRAVLGRADDALYAARGRRRGAR